MTDTKKQESATGAPVERKIIKGKHKLTTDEKITNSEELSDAMQEKEILDAEKKDKVAEYNTKISKKEEVIKACLDKIRTGEEDRDFECRVDRNYETKEKHFVHIDSGRVIKSVPFTASDFQTEIKQNDDLDETEEEEKE